LKNFTQENPTPAEGPVKSIILNEEYKANEDNTAMYLESIVFEMNYQTGTWRKLRRKRPAKLPKTG
jgi:hypothetical protein